VLDTTRADRLGVYGNQRDVSPRIDALAREGEAYERAWSTASWTLPGHASLLTGQYPTRHGARMQSDVDADSRGDRPALLAEDVLTLAEILHAQGYATAAFAGAGWLAPEFGLLQGYDVQDAENYRTLPAAEITSRAVAWLDGVPADRPVHLLVNYFDAHWPYDPPKDFPTFPRAHETLSAVPPGHPVPDVERPILLDRYDSAIRYVDHHVGRLFDALRRLGRYDGSLIVVTADHGEMLGEHGASGHGAWLYEGVLRIPLVVRRPGGRDGGRRIGTPVSIVDVLPLVLTELGLPVPDGIDGAAAGARDLVLAEEVPSPLFKNLDVEPSLDRDLLAAIRWPWKLVVPTRGRPELYRLDDDPAERRDVADGDEERRLAADLAAARAAIPEKKPDRTGPLSDRARENLRALGYLE